MPLGAMLRPLNLLRSSRLRLVRGHRAIATTYLAPCYPREDTALTTNTVEMIPPHKVAKYPSPRPDGGSATGQRCRVKPPSAGVPRGSTPAEGRSRRLSAAVRS